jgi:hypothetical protein
MTSNCEQTLALLQYLKDNTAMSILKHTQAEHQQAMSDYVTRHWAQYRAGEIDFAQAKALAK